MTGYTYKPQRHSYPLDNAVNFKDNMEEIYFTRLKVGYPGERHPPEDVPGSWKIFTICHGPSPKACQTIKDVTQLSSVDDIKEARLLFIDLANKAKTGLNLSLLYDIKICHEAHSFTHGHKECKIFRIRRSGIRAYFVYFDGKIIILIKTDSKRKQKLSVGEKKVLEDIAKSVIDRLSDDDFYSKVV